MRAGTTTLRSISALAEVLPLAWSADTAWIDDWQAGNPARGQCGSTALVLQDLCGGDLVHGIVHDGRRAHIVHYWNVLDAGPIDLTWTQFGAAARVVRYEVVGRADLLWSAWFERRYETLRWRVDQLLAR
jgi:hypothetical protein